MSELTREDVQQILDLIDKAQYDYFELQDGDLKLVVNRTGLPIGGLGMPQAGGPPAAPVVPPQSAVPPAPPSPISETSPPTVASKPAQPAPASSSVDHATLVPIAAPMVGVFYAQPEPGAPPFVAAGSRIDEESTMGLIEVMKVFTAVRAGVRGTVAEILVQNAEFVEFGQTLFYVRPDDAASGHGG